MVEDRLIYYDNKNNNKNNNNNSSSKCYCVCIMISSIDILSPMMSRVVIKMYILPSKGLIKIATLTNEREQNNKLIVVRKIHTFYECRFRLASKSATRAYPSSS